MSTKIADLTVGVEVAGGAKAKKELNDVERASKELRDKGASYLEGFKLGGVGSFGAVGIAVGAVVTALVAGTKALFDFTEETSKQYDRIDKESKKIGLSAQEFQKFEFAAGRSGASVNAVGDGLKKLGMQMNTALSEGKETPFTQALNDLRINIDELKATDAQGKLEIIAGALADIEDPAERVTQSMILLGESAGPELQPLLEGGAAGIRAYMVEAEKYGLVTDEAVASGAIFQDSMLNLETEFKSIKGEIFQSLAPSFIEIIDKVKEWVGENEQFLKQDMATALSAVGGALVTLTEQIFYVVDGWRGFIKEIEDTKSGLQNDYPNAFNILGGAINSLVHPIEGVQQLFEGWKGIFEKITEWIGGVLSGPFDKLTTWFSDTFPRATEVFGSVFDAVRGPIDKIGETIHLLVDKVKAFFDQFSQLKDLAASLGLIDEVRSERGAPGFLGGGEDLKNPEVEKKKKDADTLAREKDSQARDAAKGRKDRSEATALIGEIKAEKRVPSEREVARLQDLGVTPAQIEAVGKGVKPPPVKKGKSPKEVTSKVTAGEAWSALRAGAGDAGIMMANMNQISSRAPDTKGVQPTVAIHVTNLGPFTFHTKGGNAKDIAKEVKAIIDKTIMDGRAKTGSDLTTSVIL